MSWVAVAVGGATLLGGALGSRAQERAANRAADAQSAAALAGIEEQRRQFDEIRALLSPYVSAGNLALGQTRDLLGLTSPEAQRAAIEALQQGPEFQTMLRQGESSILANAAATGGLRGGNVQRALGEFSPRLLAETINQRFNRLGGLVSLGQNAAVGVGNAGLATGRGIADLLGQYGAAQAGGALAGGRAQAGYLNSALQGLGAYFGARGFGGGGGSTPPPSTNWALAGIPSGVEF